LVEQIITEFLIPICMRQNQHNSRSWVRILGRAEPRYFRVAQISKIYAAKL